MIQGYRLPLAASILIVSFLSSAAIVPAPGQCWTDRIFAFSGALQFSCNATKRCINETLLLDEATKECGQFSCNATKRCVNETLLLDEATKECGQVSAISATVLRTSIYSQPPKNYTFRERCGFGHSFGIDYTCCAPYQFHEHCLLEPRWQQNHTDKLLTMMKKVTRLAKGLHVNMTEPKKILEDVELWQAFTEFNDYSGNLTSMYYMPSEGITKCTQTSDQHVTPKNSTFISRHRTYFEFRKGLENRIFVTKYYDLPQDAMRFAYSNYYNCTAHRPPLFHSANPKEMAEWVYEGCYFFPELEETNIQLAFELNHNRSIGFDPPGKDFWKAEDATEKYCQWIVEKLTDPEWEGEDASQSNLYSTAGSVLLLTVSVLVVAALGFTLWKRKTEKDTESKERSTTVVYHIFNDEGPK
uniref:Uncharacterized protein n=1 Tax=Steinernema glaseri TaxID=37863 RepID=A0A1I7ZI41_9BILA